MKATIETLKDNLKKKSRENRELEVKIRQEVTEEMAQQLVRIQEEADERVAEAQVGRWFLGLRFVFVNMSLGSFEHQNKFYRQFCFIRAPPRK